ncbi:short-chain dehydrogenase/reductase [Acinetobacter sp. ANC 4558]|uniref:SDR family NAD(P)-dependent oxidoreductase n=1 Tax=Acinetobacter sp. ANC 4558 TaxID=1977876 RepID=UPI000A3521C5|nr:SDR family NAD(P)-dependent oxidoreductase [Acinetobacter sp. ANC 4558]OTG87081.1 short-chain dehydrogenase/reductase [Acinetobacter sp. ANC 4558]
MAKWFITGASSGLGLELTKKLLVEGHTVVAAVRRTNILEELRQEYPQTLIVESLDVTETAQIKRVALRHPDVDVVVNNAGGAIIGAMEELTEQDIQQQISLNLLAPIHITRAFLPTFRAKSSGTFIHITSIGGRVSFAAGSLYHAAKFGLEGFAESVSQEVSEFGIKTLIIEPGSIKTGFVANIQWTNESDFYKNSTVGHLRHWIQENGEETTSGDPKKMANVIFNLSQLEHPPLRTTLGIDAYSTLEKAYQNSLSILQSQKELAESVAFEGKMGFIPS